MIFFIKLAYVVVGLFFVVIFSVVMINGLELNYDTSVYSDGDYHTVLNPLEYNIVFDKTGHKFKDFFFNKVTSIKNLPIEYMIESYNVDWASDTIHVVDKNKNKRSYSLNDGDNIQFLFELFLSFK
ncbi:hypothetical protein AL387_gp148 [Salmon gill poxvirus]|uniref:Uncharacterized protein n=1 Tax=Salmon gill poxvirus TaxID=1680908 RepID=A0A0H4Y1I1_9POXV|nr:hypothetical protein AL387_gp148 [Salmon gill poxvirus]AKR04272.1 hypothetical protein SGPV148 [Salmon gill poxvirus]